MSRVRRLIVVAIGLMALGPASMYASSPRELYVTARAREVTLRQQASTPSREPTVADYRAVVAAYEAVVRRYPATGYVDNALWQGALVARDAFDRFKDDRDRKTARRLLALLVSDYPISPFVSKAKEITQTLDGGASTSVTPAPVPASPVTAPPPSVPGLPAASPPPDTPRLPAPPPGGYSIARQLGLGASRIVLDPGHGGHDPGASGAGEYESQVVLDVSLRLELLLQEAGFDVVMTRRSDQFVPLEERAAIANREHGDLFLSIHANASRNQNARGIESYVLNFATDPAAETLAARENAATERTMSNLNDLLKAISTNSKIEESRAFARLVERSMATNLKPVNQGVRDLGVKQAPFVVLIGTAMPSVLAEISFMTNAQEGRLLASDAYRQRIADALCQAVQTYQKSLKSASTMVRQ